MICLSLQISRLEARLSKRCLIIIVKIAKRVTRSRREKDDRKMKSSFISEIRKKYRKDKYLYSVLEYRASRNLVDKIFKSLRAGKTGHLFFSTDQVYKQWIFSGRH